jgi:type VI secretion system protein ImpF
MRQTGADQPLASSLLDRLLDDDPSLTREPSKTRTQLLRDLKQSVRRDLENLLNTRRCYAVWPAHLEELERSLVGYGIPDITSTGLGTAANREDFRAAVEDVIRQFEPRFKSVVVEMLENSEPVDRTLRFRIRALLRVDPAPEPVVFDSMLQPATGNIEVRGTNR